MAPGINEPTDSSVAKEGKSSATATTSRGKGRAARVPRSSPPRTRANARKKKTASAVSAATPPKSPPPAENAHSPLSVDSGTGARLLTLPVVVPTPRGDDLPVVQEPMPAAANS